MEIDDEQSIDLHCSEVQSVVWESDTPSARSVACGCNRRDKGIVCYKFQGMYALPTTDVVSCVLITGDNVSRLQEILAKQVEGGCKGDCDALLDEEAKIQSMDYFCRNTNRLSCRRVQ